MLGGEVEGLWSLPDAHGAGHDESPPLRDSDIGGDLYTMVVRQDGLGCEADIEERRGRRQSGD